MKQLFKRVWHDPVWSKVIATAIPIIAGIVWGYVSGWRSIWDTLICDVYAICHDVNLALRYVASWLLAVWGIPRFVVLVVIALLLFLVVWQYVRLKSAAQLLEDSKTEKARQRGETAADEQAMWEARRLQVEAEAARDNALAKVGELEEQLNGLVPPSSAAQNIDDTKVSILRVLYRHYPNLCDLRYIAGQASLTYAICESHVERLTQMDLVQRVRPNYTSDGGFSLTAGGRDFYIAKGI